MASVWNNMSVNKLGYIHINPDKTFALHFDHSHTLRQRLCPAKYNNECALFNHQINLLCGMDCENLGI